MGNITETTATEEEISSRLDRWKSIQENSPMRLCSACSLLTPSYLQSFQVDNVLEHQPSFSALLASVEDGCEMCALFLDGLVESYTSRSSFSEDGEAERPTRADAYQAFHRIESSSDKSACLLQANIGGFSSNGVEDTLGVKYWIPSSWKMTKLQRVPQRWNDPVATFSLCNRKGRLHCVFGSGIKLTGTVESINVLFSETELSPDPDFEIARRWMNRCIQNHPDCDIRENHERGRDHTNLPHAPPQLPSRVIDVGNAAREPHLFISQDIQAEYVTLSHCWGRTRPLVTTTSNIDEHILSIPIQSMPRTFQDAVLVTRNLGFQFLWIDSLCIIQDSALDWQIESSKMASIYQNSVLTIFGITASHAESGFLHPRIPTEPQPHKWESQSATSNEVIKYNIQYIPTGEWSDAKFPRSSRLTRSEADSPHESRGWILQEYLLSPRLLFFGAYRMYWQCNTCAAFEDYPDAEYLYYDKRKMHCSLQKHDVLTPPTPYPKSKFGIWYRIVEEFSRRLLTKPTDTLPALSGIASWLWGGKSAMYVAGLLKDDIENGLSWRRHSSNGKSPKWNSESYIGPSWSWISCEYSVEFLSVDASHEEFPQPAELKVQEVQIDVPGKNPFGEVISGLMRLKAVLREATVGPPREGSSEPSLSTWDGGPVGILFPDKPSEWQNPQGRKIEFFLLNKGTGIAIQPLVSRPPLRQQLDGTGTEMYRRIGHAVFTMPSEYRTYLWEQDCSWKDIELF